MAKHCVNIGSDQFKILADQSDLNTLDLSATVSLWQDDKDTYDFPTLEELNKFNEKYTNPEPRIPDDITYNDKGEVLAPNGEVSKLYNDIKALDEVTTDEQALEYYKQTRSNKFKEWFKDSKVVDENGEPLMVYHGSVSDFTTFKNQPGYGSKAKSGIFFTPFKNYADGYSDMMMEFKQEQYEGDYEGVKKVYPVFLNIEEPIVYKGELKNINSVINDNVEGIIATVGDIGFNDDLKPVEQTQYIVFKPNQIKSIFNKGEFSSESDNILFQLPKIKPDDTQAKNNAYRDKVFKSFNLRSKPKANKVDLAKLEKEVDSKMNNFLEKANMEVKSVKEISDGKGNIINAIAKADIFKQAIEVVEGLKELDTLPEESAHVFVALSRGTEGYNAMMDKITEFPIYEDVVNRYTDQYKGDEVKLREEAVGQLIAQEIINKVEESLIRPGLLSFVKRAWNNMWDFISRKLGLLNSKDIALFSNSAMAILNPTKEVMSKLNDTLVTEEDYFYEMTKKDTDRVDMIKSKLNPDNAKLKALEVGYAILESGKKIKHRVSDFVKAYYHRKYSNSDRQFSKLDNMKAVSGTYLHGLRERIGLDLIDGVTPKDMRKQSGDGDIAYKAAIERSVKAKISSELPEFKKLLDSQNKKGKGLFEISESQYYDLIADEARLFDHIMETNARINKLNGIEGNPPPTIIPEAMIYLESEDLAGTLDKLVVYNNGAASIYDYKSTDFGYKPGEISQGKKEGWDVQISQYKRILELEYGVTYFVETRVIPMNASFATDPSTKEFDVSSYGKLESGALNYLGNENARRDYLDYVPVADELTDDTTLNSSLKKLFSERSRLRNLVDRTPGNADLQVKLEKMDFAIKQIQLKKDTNYVINEIGELISNFRNKNERTKEQEGYLNLKELNNISEYAKIFEGFGKNAKKSITEENIPDNEEREDRKALLDRIETDLATLRDDVYHAIEDRLRGEIDFDIKDIHKEPDMLGRLFTSLGDWDSPVFQSLHKLVVESSDATRLKVNDVVETITAKKDSLEKWAESNNMTLLEAYAKIINPKTKRLIPQLKPEFYAERDNALKTNDTKWIAKNLDFDFEGFKTARDNKHNAIDIRFSGEHNKDENVKRKNAWEERFNEDAIRPGNYFFKPIENNPKWFSNEWNYMLKNKPLKEYYETLMDYNEQFAELTGADITKNFIPNFRQDTIDRMSQTGVLGIGHMLKNLKHSIEVRDNDISSLEIDPYTGKRRTSIPLYGMQSLRERLTPNEEKAISDEIIAKGKAKGSLDYELALESAIKSAEYKKGVEYKSIDLTSSLILFAESAYSNAHLQQSEDAARGLKKMLESGMIDATITSEEGGILMNKLKGITAKRIGVDPADINDFDKFLNMYYYGLNTQNADAKLNTLVDNVSNLNLTNVDEEDRRDDRFSTKTYYSRDKILRKIKNFTSLNNLALDPILGAANMLGAWSNLMIVAHGGKYFNGNDVRAARNEILSRSEKARAFGEYWEVAARSLTKEKADKASAKAITKIVTMDNMFIQYKLGDDLIDDTALVAMAMSHGVDSDGVIKKLSKASKGTKSMWEASSINKKTKKLKIDGLENNERIKFRVGVQKVASRIKGSVPEESKTLVGTHIAGEMMMQHRGWIPDLLKARVGNLKYDKMTEQFEVGRFKVIAGELSRSGHVGDTLKAFTNLLKEVVLCAPVLNRFHNYSVYDTNTSIRATNHFYDQFIAKNPNMRGRITKPEFLELRQSKLREFAKEVSILASFMLSLALLTAALPDDDEDKLTKFLADNSYKTMNRGLLEMTFFFSPSSATDILSNPVAALSGVMAIGNWFKAAGKMLIPTNDFTEDHLGTSDKDLKKFLKKTSGIMPVVGSWTDFAGLYGDIVRK